MKPRLNSVVIIFSFKKAHAFKKRTFSDLNYYYYYHYLTLQFANSHKNIYK